MGRAVLLVLLLVIAALPVAHAQPTLERRLVSYDEALPQGVLVMQNFAFARVALVEAPAAVFAALGLPSYPEESLTLNLDRARQVDRADPLPGDESFPRGANVTIALVDSGLDASHPGLVGRVAAAIRISRMGLVSSGGTDDDGHGTHVAGILAGSGAQSQNERLRGIAPAAQIVGIDIRDSFTTTSAVRAFEWIHTHRDEYKIRVVSNSWGREKDDTHYDPDDPVVRATNALVNDGIVVVFSAGNRGRDGAATLTVEGTNPNAITVGAATAGGRVEAYSSRGPPTDGNGVTLAWTKPDLVAPGSAILSARTSSKAPAAPASNEDRYYWLMNGTSMAAPQVAAAAALLLDHQPHLTPALVAAILQQTARDAGAPGPDSDTGYGMLDVRAALDAARALESGKRVIVTESRIPIRASGAVTAAEGIIVLSSGQPQVPPAELVDIPVTLPANARQVDLWFNWTGPGSFSARIGEWAFESAGAQSLRLKHAAQPGSYHIIARPQGALVHSDYSLEGSALLREERVVDSPVEYNSRPMTPNGGFLVNEGAVDRALHALRNEPYMVLSSLIVVSLGAAGMLVRRRL